VKWLLFLFCIVHSAGYSYGQSAPTAKHRWAKHNIKFPDDLVKKYAHLPEADYTPFHQLENWSAKDALRKYAGEVNGKLQVQCMLTVDDKGFIRAAEVLRSDDARRADALKAILLNTQTQGPSFVRNKAVACFVPCSIKIEARQVTIQ
jgi:hypothetical protein